MKFLRKNVSKVVAFIFLAFMACIWLVPIAWAILTSFKSEAEIVTNGYRLLPIQWVLKNYVSILTNTSSAPIIKWFFNSLLISTTHTILVIIVSSMAAYAYARLRFKGRDAIFIILISTMMFPSIVNLVPLYKISDFLGWINTPMAVIVPGLGGVLNIYLIRQFMLGIPKDFDEAARVEGAGEFTIYIKIILPMLRPVLTVVGLFSFTGSWNDFLWPSIVFNDVEKIPLTPGLKLLQGVYESEFAHLMTGAVLAMIPTFIVYLFAQKYFLEGLAITSGVKG
ncbi:carbohydrate ABC transporter permease [Clostridium thermarum]|uniref:carbohydrate ABC transporter permease n=1 Tax=Clostridium thermarum TaxID=1716543 RepID=UPI0011202CEC|nr:carbohydrate ABC transporter permease [Clostridium thermarum]